MRKVAYISPTFFSNVDIPFIHALKGMCDVYYFAIVPFDGKGYAINLKHLPAKGGIYAANEFPEIQLFDQIIDLNKTYLVYYNVRSAFSPKNILVSYALLRILRNLDCDVYHFTEPFKFGEWPLYHLRRKSVFSVHDPFMHSSNNMLLIKIYRAIAFRAFSRYILFNRAQKEDFIQKHHLKSSQVFISALSSYTYLRLYSQRESPDYHYALYTGTIRSHKGIEYLMEAMRYVHDRYPDFKLVIAGSGPFYFDISEYLKDDYYIIINKFLDDSEQVPLIAHADYIVCPYIDATQSGVIMSAYAFSKPCIVTNVGGLPEMVGDGTYGMIVPPCDVQALADAMCEMIAHPEHRQQYSREINQDYSEGSRSWQSVAEHIVRDVYEEIT